MPITKEILFNPELNDIIVKNVEIFAFEYPNISDKKWKEFKNKPNCQKCRMEIFAELKKDSDKLNTIFSRLLDDAVIVNFPGPLTDPIVKEFDNIVEMEKFLKDIKKKGIMIRSASPSPNGKGGFVLICL